MSVDLQLATLGGDEFHSRADAAFREANAALNDSDRENYGGKTTAVVTIKVTMIRDGSGNKRDNPTDDVICDVTTKIPAVRGVRMAADFSHAGPTVTIVNPQIPLEFPKAQDK